MDPKAFPKAISVFPRSAEFVETMASGRVVHRLTRVAPMIISGIFEALAIQTAESTNQSLPLIIMISPAVNRIKGIICSNIYILLLYCKLHCNKRNKKRLLMA